MCMFIRLWVCMRAVVITHMSFLHQNLYVLSESVRGKKRCGIMTCYVSGRKEVYHCWFHLRLFAQQHSIILLAGQVENNVFDGTWTPATGCVCESGRVCVFISCRSFNAHIIVILCLHKDTRCHWCEAACVRPAALLFLSPSVCDIQKVSF